MSDGKIFTSLRTTPTRRQMIARTAIGFGAVALSATKAWGGAVEEVSHSAESIHQEIAFKASRKRVYEALTETKQFNSVILLSAAMKSGLPPGAAPTEISREVGGTFTIYAGHIVGRHLELAPSERIVQAWRVVDWDPGSFSIAKFQLVAEGSATKLIFDHSSFPRGTGEHLAEGWRINYWEPLEKFLSGAAA